MTVKTTLIGLLAGLAVIAAAPLAEAGTAMEKALEQGAERLTADEIAERFAGKTLTFVSASGDKRFHIYYGEGNQVAGKLVGGDWSGSGIYGVANDDQVCLGWETSDLPRLRCLYVLVVDGEVRKYKADGSLSGRIVEFEDGNML